MPPPSPGALDRPSVHGNAVSSAASDPMSVQDPVCCSFIWLSPHPSEVWLREPASPDVAISRKGRTWNAAVRSGAIGFPRPARRTTVAGGGPGDLPAGRNGVPVWPRQTGGPPLDICARLDERGWLLADGATGTNYFAEGLGAGDPPELWNVDHPDRVRRLHRAFIEAGADIVLSNSFGGNCHRLKLHRAQDRVGELNAL